MANKIIFELDLDSKKLEQKLDGVKGESKKKGKKAGEGFASGFSNGLKEKLNVKKVLLGGLALAAAGITGLVTASVMAASKVETLSLQFSTLLKSASLAKKQINDLTDFAAKTPFKLEGLANASRTLLAFGATKEQSISLLKNLGDAAAATGEPIKDLAQIFGQIKVAGKLTGERFLQLAERGINVGPAIAKAMNKSEAEVAKLRTEGKITFEIFDKAFKSMTEGAGMFAGGMKKLSESTSGLYSTLEDNLFKVFASIGQKFEPIIKKILKDATTLVQNIGNTVDFKQITLNVLLFAKQMSGAVSFIADSIDSFKLIIGFIKVSIQEFVAVTVSGFSKIVQGAASMANKVSGFFGGGELIPESATQGIKDFAESTRLVANDMQSNLEKSIGSAFNNDTEKFDAYIDELYNQVNQINEVTAEAKPIKVLPEKEKIIEETSQLLAFFNSFGVYWENSAKKMAETSKKLTASFKGTLVKGISGGIQNIVQSVMNGENAFKNFGKFVLGIFADMAIQMGTILIGAGLGVDALKALGGAAAVAAGIGLVAVGTVLKSLVGGGSTAGATADNYTGSSATPTQESPIAEQQLSEEGAQPNTTVNLTVQGNILDRRESGLEIVNIINEAIDSDSVVINQAFA